MAADCKFEIKTPIKLAAKFKASLYASAREYERTNPRACVVYVLEPIEFAHGSGAQAAVRRIEPSASFERQFGRPKESIITLEHALGPVLPINRKMTRPRSLSLTDLNGADHECVAEAFDTTHNVLILLYPWWHSLKTTVILPQGFKERLKVGGSA